jgi:hypothetical protein
MSRTRFGLPLLAALAFTVPGLAQAETLHFVANLNGKQESPANSSDGKGQATLTLDTAAKTFTINVTYSGLTGPAIMGHIHGPGAPGDNSPIQFPFNNPASPINYSGKLTDSQMADLIAGRYYVNIHTNAFKGGEIRGQLTK